VLEFEEQRRSERKGLEGEGRIESRALRFEPRRLSEALLRAGFLRLAELAETLLEFAAQTYRRIGIESDEVPQRLAAVLAQNALVRIGDLKFEF
jgi:hypothetical protein